MIKDSIKITLLILLAALLIGGMVLIIFNKSIFGLNINKQELLLSKEFSIENIEQLKLDVETDDIEIYESETENIKVKIYGEDINDYKIEDKNDELYIKSKHSPCIGICFNNKKIEIYLPENFDRPIDIDGTSNDVVFNIPINSDINIKSTSGDVDIKNANNVVIELISGDVKAGRINNANIKTTSGDIDIDEVTNIDAESLSGDIKISSINISKDSYLKSTSGDIEINNTNDIYVEANTTSGDINIKNNNRLAQNVLKIKTTSGDISVR